MLLVDMSGVGRIELLTGHILREYGLEVPHDWCTSVELLPDTNEGRPVHARSKYYPEGTAWRERWKINVGGALNALKVPHGLTPANPASVPQG